MPVLQWRIGLLYDSIVQLEATSRVKSIAAVSGVKVSADGRGVVSHAGMGLIRELADLTGLSAHVTAVLADTYKGPWVYAPGPVFADLAAAVADGADCLTGRGWPRPPAWSPCPPGLPEPGLSCARNARTRVRNHGSPTPTACGSPPSSSTPQRGSFRGSSPAWNCAIASRPASRTESSKPKPPAWPTCHSFDANAAWLEIVLTAADLVAWAKLIGFTDTSQLASCEISAFRYRILHVAARITRGARQLRLRIDATWR